MVLCALGDQGARFQEMKLAHILGNLIDAIDRPTVIYTTSSSGSFGQVCAMSTSDSNLSWMERSIAALSCSLQFVRSGLEELYLFTKETLVCRECMLVMVEVERYY
mmetsp:Transcript_1115/g.2010  ORF Transcript_1115/g.2010 Transcript_1115/m.2010 type:complete len:106 (+) Transcript_1115:699-1016(+)